VPASAALAVSALVACAPADSAADSKVVAVPVEPMAVPPYVLPPFVIRYLARQVPSTFGVVWAMIGLLILCPTFGEVPDTPGLHLFRHSVHPEKWRSGGYDN